MCRVRRSAGILKRDRKFQFFFLLLLFPLTCQSFLHTHTHRVSIIIPPSFSSSFSHCVKESYFVGSFFSLSISFHYYSSSSSSAFCLYNPLDDTMLRPGNAHTHAVPGGYLISGWFQIASLNREKRMTEDEEKKNSGRPSSFSISFSGCWLFLFFPHLVYLDAAASV